MSSAVIQSCGVSKGIVKVGGQFGNNFFFLEGILVVRTVVFSICCGVRPRSSGISRLRTFFQYTHGKTPAFLLSFRGFRSCFILRSSSSNNNTKRPVAIQNRLYDPPGTFHKPSMPRPKGGIAKPGSGIFIGWDFLQPMIRHLTQ